MYQDTRNTSSIPNEQKQIFAEKNNEKPQRPEPQPTLSVQYYQPPPRPTGPRPPIDIAPYMPIAPIAPYGMQPMMYPPYPYQPQMYFPPVIKNVQINADGPTAQHQKLFIVHEDAMPSKPIIPSANSLGERLHLYQFVRSSILNNVDGADISLDGKGDHSLLSFVKFADLNPYNTYKFSSNPYRGLPNGFLVYRSCYPIRHQESTGGVSCAKDPTGINIRIYKLLEGSFLINKLNAKMFYEYDEWREVAFYEYIREYILKKKVCPHFSMLYGYFICEKTGIDYNAIEILKNNRQNELKKPEEPTMRVVGTYITNDDQNIYINPNATGQYFNTGNIVKDGKIVSMNNNSIQVQNNGKIIDINPDAYLGKSLVLLTESPMYNIFGWASKTYQVRGNIKEMVNRGTHTEKEWMNMLFQLMVSLCVMQLNKIIIRNFSLEKNVFVKDLPIRGQITNYWKYKVDDMDFYIPNLGYLLMIDSNFKDLEEQVEFSLNQKTDSKYKIDGKFIGDSCKLTDSEITNLTFEMFKNAFDVNCFNQEFTKDGGCKPPSEVLNIMSQISAEIGTDTDKNIKKYIGKYMRQFTHNRIGTYLKEAEVQNIRRDDTREFKKGQILVFEEGFGAYKFVMYLETSNGATKILTKNDVADNDIIETTVPTHSLINYSKAENIMQTFKPNEANMNEEEMLETYFIRE